MRIADTPAQLQADRDTARRAIGDCDLGDFLAEARRLCTFHCIPLAGAIQMARRNRVAMVEKAKEG